MKINKTLSIFLLCHLVVWSILPIILRANLPMDSAEALIWGMVGEWGTNKHPPLSGWLADWFWLFCGKNPQALYILSQVLVIGALIYIYKLARCFLSKEKALFSAVLMEGVAYYGLVTPEYNCNIVALLLWPACTYHFYCGVKNNLWRDWLAFGVFAGLNLLNKYVSGALLFSLGLYLLCSHQGRARLTSFKLYLASFLALVIVIPHFIWLYNRDFFVIDYFLSRAGHSNLTFGLGHIVYPLKFLLAQILAAGAALLVLCSAWYFGKKEKSNINKSDKIFIFFAGILPLLIMITVPIITGNKLKSMWGSPSLYMLTIIWLVFLPFDVVKIKNKLLSAGYALLVLFATAFTLQCVTTLSPKFNLNAIDLAKNTGADKAQYVGGSVWLSSILGVYASSHPQVIFELNPAANPWIDMNDVLKKGFLVVEENLDVYNAHRTIYPLLEDAKIYKLTARNIWGKTKEYTLYYGNLSGENK